MNSCFKMNCCSQVWSIFCWALTFSLFALTGGIKEEMAFIAIKATTPNLERAQGFATLGAVKAMSVLSTSPGAVEYHETK